MASIENGDKNRETLWTNIVGVFLDFRPCIYFLDGKVLVDFSGGGCLGDISMLVKRLALKSVEAWAVCLGGIISETLHVFIQKKEKRIQTAPSSFSTF